MNAWRYDAAAVAVGDTVWVRRPRGWRNFGVTQWKAVRKTATGQVVAEYDARSIRINPRGKVIGDPDSRVVSDAEAREIQSECREDALWNVIRSAANDLADASRTQNRDIANAAVKKATDALAKLPTHSEAEV